MTKLVRVDRSKLPELVEALRERAAVDVAGTKGEVRACELPECGRLFELPAKGAGRKKRYCCKAHGVKHANDKMANAAQYSGYRTAHANEVQAIRAKLDAASSKG